MESNTECHQPNFGKNGKFREKVSSPPMKQTKHQTKQTIQDKSLNINKQTLSNKHVNMSNKFLQAFSLPVLVNMNPRSIYNKVDEFHEFVKQYTVDCIFLSESWERENMLLSEIIKLENYSVISNVSQRKGVGGRPAIIVNNQKYNVQNITNSLLQIKWGVEAVWCILTPKNVSSDSKIQKIACAAIYSKPGSKSKTDLLDHKVFLIN